MRISYISPLIIAAAFVGACGRDAKNNNQVQQPAAQSPTAQSPAAQSSAAQGSLAMDIHKAIIAVTGYDASAVEVTIFTGQLAVNISNSKLLESDRAARKTEAAKISAATVKVLESGAAVNSIRAMQINYLSRAQASKPRVVDAIDFRKSPQGKFLMDIS